MKQKTWSTYQTTDAQNKTISHWSTHVGISFLIGLPMVISVMCAAVLNSSLDLYSLCGTSMHLKHHPQGFWQTINWSPSLQYTIYVLFTRIACTRNPVDWSWAIMQGKIATATSLDIDFFGRKILRVWKKNSAMASQKKCECHIHYLQVL